MDIDGKKYCDSMPMMRMLGIKMGIYDPKDPTFTYHCDLVLDKFSDCVEAHSKYTSATVKAKQENKKVDAALKDKYCTILEKFLNLVCD